MGERRRARELALQMLYRHELAAASVESMLEDFDELRRAPERVREFALHLVRGTLGRLPEIDAELSEQTTNWRLERLAAVDRNILRLAAYELLYEPDTPPAVVIDEAIEIAKRFGADESARFVNGVLDGLRRRRVGGR